MDASAIIEDDNNEFTFNSQRRKSTWSDHKEMKVFLDMVEANIQKIILKRNQPIYAHISSKMASLGFHREPSELRKKISNMIFKYKHEKTLPGTSWPYFKRVERLLYKMDEAKHTKVVQNKENKVQESSPEKPKKEPQKIVFITPMSNNVHIDEADMETILRAMNGEDDASRKNESSPTLEIIESSVVSIEDSEESADSGDMEDEEDKRRLNDVNSDFQEKADVQNSSPQVQGVSDQCSSSTLSIKRKADDQELHPRTKKNLVQESAQSKKLNCAKDEIDLYVTLLGSKLRNLNEKNRQIAMNKIDNVLFKMKMEQLEVQQHSQASVRMKMEQVEVHQTSKTSDLQHKSSSSVSILSE